MTLLEPAAAAWAFALAAPVLLALYMLRLRRRPVRVSITRFWPPAAKDAQANAPLARPRPSWLLLLHLLALAMLALALGRPSVGAAPAGTRVVLLIDASASMSARDESGGPTRLDRAKLAAMEEIRLATRGDGDTRFAVVRVARDARLAASFTGAPAAARDAVRAITPTDQPADLPAAWALLRALASGEGE